jgi:CheY-like chemotaxis protein
LPAGDDPLGDLHHDLSILLAEDNAVNQIVTKRMLDKLGYKADVAANGIEVLQALERQNYDVVFMDVQMPEMDGLEATRAILDLKLKKRPKILAMTAYALEGDRERCLAAGMDGYISKPVQLEELRNALQELQVFPLSREKSAKAGC